MSNEPILISQSPFFKEVDPQHCVGWAFQVKDPASGKMVDASISPYALLSSLGEERGEEELLVCGCSVAGCAGFFNEIFETTEQYIHWSLTEYGRPYSWYFDRAEYEIGAVRMLHDIYVSQVGWDFNALEYSSYERFKDAIDSFLAAKPYFKAIWDEIEEETP